MLVDFLEHRGLTKLHAARLLEVRQGGAAAERGEGALGSGVAVAQALVGDVGQDVREVRRGVHRARTGIHAQHQRRALQLVQATGGDAATLQKVRADFQQGTAHELTGAVFQRVRGRVVAVHDGVLGQRAHGVDFIAGDGDMGTGFHLFVLLGSLVDDDFAHLVEGERFLGGAFGHRQNLIRRTLQRAHGGGDVGDARNNHLLGGAGFHNRFHGADFFHGRVARYFGHGNLLVMTRLGQSP